MVPEIIGIDFLWYDEIITLPAFPANNGSAPITSYSGQGGGKVCTALAAAGRLGVSGKLISVAGDGPRGRFLVEDLRRHGVDTASIRVVPGYREGFSVVLSDAASGGRRILWRPGDAREGPALSDMEGVRAEDRKSVV